MAADHEVDMLVECVYIEIAACRIWHGAPRCFRLRVFVCVTSVRDSATAWVLADVRRTGYLVCIGQ